MASSVKNPAGQIIKLTRGRAVNLGTIALVNDVVSFTVPEPTYYNQGALIIQVANGITGGTFNMEASIDGGASWFTVTLPTVITTAQFGDQAVSAAFAPVNVSGFGSAAVFRFGLTAVTSGSAAVWASLG